MTGPEHYLEAERLIAAGGNASAPAATVHALLAVAAATALSAYARMPAEDSDAWLAATKPKRGAR